jgi:hypothetical protein
MTDDWKPGDLAVVEIKTVGKTDGFVGVGHGPVYTIPETALMPLADHLTPVDDFFDKPQTNTKDVIESLEDGDIVQVRWQHTDTTTITEGTARRTSGGGFRLGSWYFVRDHNPSALTAGATHVRIVKSAKMIYGFDNGDMTIEAALIRAMNECDRLGAAEKRIRKLHDGYTDRSDEHRVFCVDCNNVVFVFYGSSFYCL